MKKWIALSMTAFAYLHFEMREFITPLIGPAIAKTPAVGLIPAHSFKRIAARRMMT